MAQPSAQDGTVPRAQRIRARRTVRTVPPRQYRISVTDCSSIVPRGEQIRIWWVRLNDGWVRAHQYPGAEVELGGGERCPPGVVWRREIELRLDRGALLRCAVSEPAPDEGLQPLDYLRREIRSARRRRRVRTFRVTGNYRLSRAGELDPPHLGAIPRTK